MWKRSEVEQLTGLTRHMIQDLCNQNTSGDGLAFWVPAVSKPGYSRFDEGDLLVFYLVKQLSKAGFALAEVEAAVMDMLEEDEAFGERIAGKAHQLESERAAIEAKLAATEVLRSAVGCAPEERLYAIMGAALTRAASQAVDEAARCVAGAEQSATVAAARGACTAAVPELLEALGWSARAWTPDSGAAASPAAAAESSAGTGARDEADAVMGDPAGPTAHDGLAECLRRFSEMLADVRQSGAKPDSAEAAAMLRQGAAAFWDRWRPADAPVDDEAARTLLLAVAATFLAQPENGVPVELALGKGSFAYLGMAAAAAAMVIGWRGGASC